MQKRNRNISWSDTKKQVEDGPGTVVGEWLAHQGPVRFWWTEEEIPATSQTDCCFEKRPIWSNGNHANFYQWCGQRFTDPDRGIALLIEIPVSERKRASDLFEKLRLERRYVTSLKS